MQIDLEKIKKLPPDVRDRFQKLLIKYKAEDRKKIAKNDFLSFVKTIWPEFIEGEHQKTIADKIADTLTNRLVSISEKNFVSVLPK